MKSVPATSCTQRLEPDDLTHPVGVIGSGPAAGTAPTLAADGAATMPPCSTVRPYMSAEQLEEATPWTVPAIRKMMARGILKLGVHYFRPLGRRREVVFKWSAIVEMIEQQSPIMEETQPAPCPRRMGIDVEQATADLERLLS